MVNSVQFFADPEEIQDLQGLAGELIELAKESPDSTANLFKTLIDNGYLNEGDGINVNVLSEALKLFYQKDVLQFLASMPTQYQPEIFAGVNEQLLVQERKLSETDVNERKERKTFFGKLIQKITTNPVKYIAGALLTGGASIPFMLGFDAATIGGGPKIGGGNLLGEGMQPESANAPTPGNSDANKTEPTFIQKNMVLIIILAVVLLAILLYFAFK